MKRRGEPIVEKNSLDLYYKFQEVNVVTMVNFFFKFIL